MKLRRIDLDKFWHRPLKSYIIKLDINLRLFDRTQIDMIFWYLLMSLFINRIFNNIFNITLTLMRNLDSFIYYFG